MNANGDRAVDTVAMDHEKNLLAPINYFLSISEYQVNSKLDFSFKLE